MNDGVMRESWATLRERLRRCAVRLLELAAQAAGPELREVAAGLVNSVDAPFLFVVVGEVKAGKSSFVNALLGDEVCAVAPDPCTDCIQKIVHSREPYERGVAEHVREVGRPCPILSEIAVVDTPGTNSIIDRHQEVTERFLPESDMVVFVFPAVNPYARTAWDFLALVHRQWHKKLVFVLQQVDRATPEELVVNLARVRELAISRGVENPRIFPVSARVSRTDPEAGGMTALWGFIRDNITGGRQYQAKALSLASTAATLCSRIDEELAAARGDLAEDREEAGRIRALLDAGLEAAGRDIELLERRLTAHYERLAAEATREFEDGLSLGSLVGASFKGFFGKKKTLGHWVRGLVEELGERFAREVEGETRDAAARVAEPLGQALASVTRELSFARGRMRGGRGEPGDATAPLGVPSLARERLGVVDEALAGVRRLLADERMSERLRPQNLSRMGDQAVVGGFLTAVGAVIAATTHAVVFDVTGGVLSTLGALIAINTLALKRRSVVRRFREGLDEGRERFAAELSDKLAERLAAIRAEVEAAFAPYFTAVEQRSARLEDLEARSWELGREVAAIQACAEALPSPHADGEGACPS